MSKISSYRFNWIAPIIILAVIISGCASRATAPTKTPSPSSSPSPIATTSTPTAVAPQPAPAKTDVVDPNVLYHDDFTNPASGWPEAKFDNYFIGYHEPEFYHVEVTSPNYKTTVFAPEKKSFGDVTIEVKAFTASSKTAATGDYSFGVVFRRSGDQYYAFTISQRTKKWYVIKSTPNALTILAQGTDAAIHDADAGDVLRVDAQGPGFSFSINDQVVSHATDGDYAAGEVGFFVQTFDAANAHIHFDEITISNFKGFPVQQLAPGTLYHDDFTNPASGWPEAKFDNYFIGYHEPEFYHVEVSSPNYKTTVFAPEKKSFGDATIEVKTFTASSKTAATGDYSFGVAFRRSGDQYYAFAISQRTKKWYILKSAPNALTILAQGTDASIHDADTGDVLRVDAQGANFAFSINDQVVSHVTDTDYAAGEVGFFVQTFDAAKAHIHFDEITISDYKGAPLPKVEPGTLYHDDFTNPASGWPEAKFDNYFIGYHEPEFYHVEVSSPNYKTTVFAPEKKSFGDATIEVKAFTASSKTAATGDYSFGVVFRRSGDQYYAFAISQRMKKWYVLKSAPNALTILAQGSDASIHDADTGDVLRVDAQGANFSFSINDQLVGQVRDADYAAGEVGFFVQTFDAAKAHIHFDEITIKTFEPSLVCEIKALFLNVRSGPGTENLSTSFLSNGDTIKPLGRNTNGDWLLIALDGNGNQSWVFYSKEFITCNAGVDVLPITPAKGNSP